MNIEKNYFLGTFKSRQTPDNEKIHKLETANSCWSELSVTLRYLATGETFESLMYQFRIHSSTIARFIHIVYQAIYNELQDIYLKMPSTETEWEAIAPKIAERWQYPNCIGNMSALHIQKTVDLIFLITNHFLALYF